METSNIKKPVLMLSYYLNDNFKFLFEQHGFEVYHHDHFPLTPSAQAHVLKHISDPESARAERMNWHDIAVRQYTSWFMNVPIDAVLEWQHGPDDFPLLKLYHNVRKLVKNMLKERYEEEIKTMPNFSKPPSFYLCLNWDGMAPENWREIGYRGLVPVFYEENDFMNFFCQVLDDRERDRRKAAEQRNPES